MYVFLRMHQAASIEVDPPPSDTTSYFFARYNIVGQCC